MTKTMSISQFMEHLEIKDNKQLKKDLLIFSLINIVLVGSIEVLTVSEKVVEAVDWF